MYAYLQYLVVEPSHIIRVVSERKPARISVTEIKELVWDCDFANPGNNDESTLPHIRNGRMKFYELLLLLFHSVFSFPEKGKKFAKFFVPSERSKKLHNQILHKPPQFARSSEVFHGLHKNSSCSQKTLKNRPLFFFVLFLFLSANFLGNEFPISL